MQDNQNSLFQRLQQAANGAKTQAEPISEPKDYKSMYLGKSNPAPSSPTPQPESQPKPEMINGPFVDQANKPYEIPMPGPGAKGTDFRPPQSTAGLNQEGASYSFGGQNIDQQSAMDRITSATKAEDLNGLNVSNDPIVMKGLQRKLDSFNQAVQPSTPAKPDKPWWEDFVDGIHPSWEKVKSMAAKGLAEGSDLMTAFNPLMAASPYGGLGGYNLSKLKEFSGKENPNDSPGSMLRSYAKDRDAEAEELNKTRDTESWGYKIGSMVPYTAGILAAVATKPVSAPIAAGIGAANLAGLSAVSFGSGLEAYDEYKKEKGQEIDPMARLGVGALYGGLEFGMERISLNKFMPKGIKGKFAKTILDGMGGETVEKTAKDLITDFANSSQSRKQLVEAALKQTGEGFVVEGSTELGTELGQQFSNYLFQEREDWKPVQDILKESGEAFVLGGIMGSAIGPISYGAQRIENQQRRSKASQLYFAETKDKNEAVEIIDVINEDKATGARTYQAIRPNGTPIEVTEDQIGDIFTVKPDTFDQLLKGKADGRMAIEAKDNQDIAGLAMSEIDQFTQEYSPYTVQTPFGQMIGTAKFNGKDVFVLEPQPNGNIVIQEQGQEKRIVAKDQLSDSMVIPFDKFVNQYGPAPQETIAPFDPSNPIQAGEQIAFEGESYVVTGINEETNQVQLELADGDGVDIVELPFEVFQTLRNPLETVLNPSETVNQGALKLRDAFKTEQEKKELEQAKEENQASEPVNPANEPVTNEPVTAEPESVSEPGADPEQVGLGQPLAENAQQESLDQGTDNQVPVEPIENQPTTTTNEPVQQAEQNEQAGQEDVQTTQNEEVSTQASQGQEGLEKGLVNEPDTDTKTVPDPDGGTNPETGKKGEISGKKASDKSKPRASDLLRQENIDSENQAENQGNDPSESEVGFTVFGAYQTGTRTENGSFRAKDGTIYTPSMVENVTDLNSDEIKNKSKRYERLAEKERESESGSTDAGSNEKPVEKETGSGTIGNDSPTDTTSEQQSDADGSDIGQGTPDDSTAGEGDSGDFGSVDLQKQLDDTFGKIADKAKNPIDFMTKARKVKNVSPELSAFFMNKYGKKGNPVDAALAYLMERRPEYSDQVTENRAKQAKLNEANEQKSKAQKQESMKATQFLNQDFEERAYAGLSEQERFEAIIEDKLATQQELNAKELAWANENMFLPQGFEMDKTGSFVPKKEVKQSQKPVKKKEIDVVAEKKSSNNEDGIDPNVLKGIRDSAIKEVNLPKPIADFFQYLNPSTIDDHTWAMTGEGFAPKQASQVRDFFHYISAIRTNLPNKKSFIEILENQGFDLDSVDLGKSDSKRIKFKNGLTITIEFKPFKGEENKFLPGTLISIRDTDGYRREKFPERFKTEKKPASTANKDNFLDVGEKIGGAKKDTYSKETANLELNTAQRIADEPLSKTVPEPDYKKLVDDGVISEDDAISLKMTRELLGRKPTKGYKLRRWVDQAMEYSSWVEKTLKGEPIVKDMSISDVVSEARKAENGRFGLQKWAEEVELYKKLNWISTGNTPGPYQIKGDGDDRYVVKGQYIVSGGRSNKLTFDEAAEWIATTRLKEQAKAKQSGGKVWKFKVYQDRKTGDIFIERANFPGIRIKQGFTTGKEAHAYIKDNYSDLVDAFNQLKDIPEDRRAENNSRIGKDHRSGKNISSAEEFMNTFGFRGVEFGNWVNAQERQDSINKAYDALMDMAMILKIPPRAIGLNGEIGLAFGARGRKGAAAHYEPAKKVINLTKESGAGSLAHEWWHGFDNYMSRRRNEPGGYMSERPREFFVSNSDPRGLDQDPTRKEIFEAFKAINKVIERPGGQWERSQQRDKYKSKKYYQQPREMTARAFESYVIDRLATQNTVNDYLANIAKEEDYLRPEVYPYPTQKEKNDLFKGFDQLFNTIKVDEKSPKKPLYMMVQEGPQVTEIKEGQNVSRPKGQVEVVDQTLPKAIETKAFKDWFGDSKVVNEDGSPMVVYHATQSDFNSFDKSKTGTAIDFGTLGEGFYFTTDTENASNYARNLSSNTGIEGGENIIPAYLAIKNPYKAKNLREVSGDNKAESRKFREKLIKKGYDGIEFDNPFGPFSWYVVFEPTQIKSATGNNGQFSPTNPDIRYTRASDLVSNQAVVTKQSRKAQVEKRAKKVMANWKNAPKLEVYADGKAIEQAYPEVQFRSIERVPGLYFDGKVIINAAHPSNSSDANLETMILHESIGHHGLNHIINDQAKAQGKDIHLEYGTLMQSVFDRYKDSGQMEYLAKTYFGKDVANLSLEEQIEMGEEYIAHTAQTGVQDKWIDRVYTKIREILRKIGFQMKMADAELRAIIGRSARFVMDGPERVQMRTALAPSMMMDPNSTVANQIESEAFKKWFGDSKVVDEKGEPLTVYHGTSSDFDTFQPRNKAVDTLFEKDFENDVYFFSNNPETASQYAESTGMNGANIIPVKLSMENPYIIDRGGKGYRDSFMSAWIKQAKDAGHDGLIVKNMKDLGQESGTQFAVFSPTQIKSATGNNGDFDGNNPDIRYAMTPDGSGIRTNDFVSSNRSARIQNRLENESNFLTNPRYMVDPAGVESVNTENQRRKFFFGKAQEFLQSKNPVSKEKRKSFRENIQDAMLPGRRMLEGKFGKNIPEEQDFYTKENLAADKIIFQIGQMENNHMKPIKALTDEIQDKFDVTYEQIEDYLMAIHNDERRRVILSQNPKEAAKQKDPKWPTGMTEEEANAIIKDYESKVDKSDRDQLNKLVKDMVNFSLDKRLESGLISQAYYDSLKDEYDHYVPLRGFEDRIEYDVTKYSPLKKAKGRKSRAASPLAYLYADAADAIAHGERNKVFQSVLEFAKKNPNNTIFQIKTSYYRKTKQDDGSQLWLELDEQEARPSKEEVEKGTVIRGFNPEIMKDVALSKAGDLTLSVWVKGQKVTIQFAKGNEQLVKALKSTSYSKVEGFLKFSGKLNRFLSSMFTEFSPEFGITNAARDFGMGTFSIIADDGFDTWKSTVKKYKSSIGELGQYFWKGEDISKSSNPYLKEFFESGAFTGFSQAKEVREIYKELSNQSISKTLSDSKLATMVSTYNKSIENALRFAYFQTLREEGLSAQKAAIKAKDVTVNFRRRGNMTSNIGALYAFFNAGVQGIERFTRPFFSNSKATRRAAQAMAGSMFVTGFMQGMLYNLFGGIDEEDDELYYDKIPDYTKAMNMIVPAPWTEAGYFMVPMGYGINVPYALGELLSQVVLGKKEKSEAVWRSLSVISDSFSPLGGYDFDNDTQNPAEKAVQFVTPTFAKPITDLAINTNFAGFQIMPQNPWDKGTPNSQNFKPTTSKAAVKAAQMVNSMTGGDDVVPGTIDPSPAAIEYLVRQYGGGPLSFAQKVTKTGELLFEGENPLLGDPARKVPLASRFYVDADNSSAVTSKYFKTSEQIQIAVDRYEKYLKKDDLTKADEYYDKNRVLIEMEGFLKSYDKDLKSLRKDMDYARDTDPELFKKLEKERDEIMKEFNLIFNQEKGRVQIRARDLLN